MSEALNEDGVAPAAEPKSKLRFLIPLALFIVLAGFLFRGLFLNPRDPRTAEYIEGRYA